MKYLFFFIPLFLFAGEGEDYLKPSDTVPANAEYSYGKSPVYDYLVEPLISLDEKWGHIVTHCSIVGEDLSQTIQTYDGVGSCLFEQIGAFLDEEKLKKNIIFHAKADDQLFNLLFQWEGLSIQEVLSSYTGRNPHSLSNQITLELLSDEQSLSDSLSYLILSGLFKTSSSEGAHLFQTASSFLLQKKIDVIQLNLAPYEEGLLKVTLSFKDSLDVEFYKLEFITNYYAGADEYFVTSVDQYQEKFHE